MNDLQEILVQAREHVGRIPDVAIALRVEELGIVVEGKSLKPQFLHRLVHWDEMRRSQQNVLVYAIDDVVRGLRAQKS